MFGPHRGIPAYTSREIERRSHDEEENEGLTVALWMLVTTWVLIAIAKLLR
jgi:hypothetical protein